MFYSILTDPYFEFLFVLGIGHEYPRIGVKTRDDRRNTATAYNKPSDTLPEFGIMGPSSSCLYCLDTRLDMIMRYVPSNESAHR